MQLNKTWLLPFVFCSLPRFCQIYNNDPYQCLIDVEKIAQKYGVIKGVLLHQGEANNGDSNWPRKVKKIYQLFKNNLPILKKE